jgi:hypothetical protein
MSVLKVGVLGLESEDEENGVDGLRGVPWRDVFVVVLLSVEVGVERGTPAADGK